MHPPCQNGLVREFTQHSGKIAVLEANDVDTDRIIPARFLSMTTKSGYGDLLFHDVRDSDFALDKPEAQSATILVVGSNFGCGSSREHAVWAIQQAGFRCVIAKRTDSSAAYSDIFRQNAANCGLLLIELPTDLHEIIAQAGTGAEVFVDLPSQTIRVFDIQIKFEINPVTKESLIKGLDLIGSTLEHEGEIGKYEESMATFVQNAKASHV